MTITASCESRQFHAGAAIPELEQIAEWCGGTLINEYPQPLMITIETAQGVLHVQDGQVIKRVVEDGVVTITVERSTAGTISFDIGEGTCDDGMPVKLAKNVVPGDVLIVDWPAWTLAEVMYVMHETVKDSMVSLCRWQVRSLDGEPKTAFIGRLSHEYVRVQVPRSRV